MRAHSLSCFTVQPGFIENRQGFIYLPGYERLSINAHDSKKKNKNLGGQTNLTAGRHLRGGVQVKPGLVMKA